MNVTFWKRIERSLRESQTTNLVVITQPPHVVVLRDCGVVAIGGRRAVMTDQRSQVVTVL